MPTSKPRIAVSLEPAQYETLRALAAMQGRSMSAVVAELIDATHPVFERLVALLAHARSEEASVHRRWREISEEFERAITPKEAEAARLVQEFFDEVDAAPSDPRLVTRGSGRNDLSTPEGVSDEI